MRLNLLSCSLTATLMVLAPMAARSSSVVVNGTCEAGSCPTVDSVSYNGSTSSPFNFNYVVGADTYNISGFSTATFNSSGTEYVVDVKATYTGIAPTTTNDSLKIDVLQNFYYPNAGNWDGLYGETVPLTLTSGAGAGSTVSGQLLEDGQSIGLVGPYGPGSYNVAKSANLSGLNGDYLNSDYQFTFDFAAGTLSGTTAVSPAPEPAFTAVAGILLFGCVAFASWRRKRTLTA